MTAEELDLDRALLDQQLREILVSARRRDFWRNVSMGIWTVVGLLALIAWQW